MGLKDDPHKAELCAAGWSTRGYLPHYDGRPIPQFITLRLADSLPEAVIKKWKRELERLNDDERQIMLQRRIEKFLDQGFGECFLKRTEVATMVQDSLLKFNGIRYRLHAWVVMPNHFHSLFSRAEEIKIWKIMQTFKSFTAHEANRILGRGGKFWFDEYFDRYMRNEKHFRSTVRYIENNPVKARLCSKPEDWPFSSAWFRARGKLK
jgi:REP element-mobilizing transposase RayT